MTAHLPCPDCGSSDALEKYEDDGHTYCHKCKKFTPGDGGSLEEAAAPSGNLIPLVELQMLNLENRGISRETCRKFSYGVLPDKHVACYFDNAGNLVHQKLRGANKNFSTRSADGSPPKMKTLLFGRRVWGDYGGQRLMITEGEIDCLSAYEALGSLGFHVVSISCGAPTALETIRANFEWVDRYQQVYLAFDNDEHGKEATAAVCNALGTSKIHVLNIPPGIKDVNELWLAQGRPAVLEAYQTAQSWKPAGIISASSFQEIASTEPTRGWDWPWPTLNHTTYGIRPGLIMVTAGSGVGKTTFFKQIEAHTYGLGLKLGVIHLEESARDTINGMLSLLHSRPFHVPDSDVTKDERWAAIDALEREDRLVMYDKTIGFDEDIILSTIRHMVQGLGCDMVFLDHLTAITDQYDTNVNQRTRNFIVKLGKLVTTVDFPLLMISHLRKADGKPHEEGGRVHLDDMLGAGAIKQWAEHVFALERDNQNEDTTVRNQPIMRDLKNRPLGEYTGTTIPMEYDPSTFVLKEAPKYGKPTDTSNSGPPRF